MLKVDPEMERLLFLFNGDRVKITTKTIRELKGDRPIAAITAYDFPTAVHADEAGIDLILVGDSVGNTVLGFPSTVPVTVEMMEHHAAAVLRALPDALVVVDLPFGEASLDQDHVLRVCRQFMQMGAGAVKLEGGTAHYDLRARLVETGIPVLGHIGLLPQQIHVEGKYRKYGRDTDEAEKILADAESVEASGCFACIGEMLDPLLAGEIRERLGIPLIGIGCGPDCDGQILVSHDMLGLGTDKEPSFVKVYAELGQQIRRSFEAYREDVIKNRFPS
jgi:3-methyl-2-oxobutanoate hydroxymethyltransferase